MNDFTNSTNRLEQNLKYQAEIIDLYRILAKQHGINISERNFELFREEYKNYTPLNEDELEEIPI